MYTLTLFYKALLSFTVGLVIATICIMIHSRLTSSDE